MPFQKGHKLSGGWVKTEKKAKSARENGKLGGRPREGSLYMVAYYNTIKKRDITKYYNKLLSATAEWKKRGGQLFMRIDNHYVQLTNKD